VYEKTLFHKSMMNIQHILFLTEHFSLPPIGGGQIRNRWLLEILREIAPVTVLSYRSTILEEIPKGVAIQPIDRTPTPAYRRMLNPIFPYFLNGYDPQIDALLEANASPTTLALASSIPMAKYLKKAKSLGMKAVLDNHNFESRVLIHYAHAERRWLEIPKAYLSQRAELRLCREADQVITPSPIETEWIQTHDSRIRIQTLPNFIDTQLYSPSQTKGRAIDFLFVGSLSYWPNQEGLLWFCRKVLPFFHRTSTNRSTIVVAGLNPSSELRQELERSGVRLDANPASSAELFNQAKITFVPLLFGSGTRLKVLEAMAAGSVVLSTPIGAEGLGLRHQKEIWISQSEQDFAVGMNTLVSDETLRRKISDTARNTVQARFDWRVFRPLLHRLMEAL
jgi:polysaccharide biosynthesis protein PslH